MPSNAGKSRPRKMRQPLSEHTKSSTCHVVVEKCTPNSEHILFTVYMFYDVMLINLNSGETNQQPKEVFSTSPKSTQFANMSPPTLCPPLQTSI